MALNHDAAIAALEEKFGTQILSKSESFGMGEVEIDPVAIKEILSYLKNHPELKVNFLTDLCAVHYPDNTGSEFCMVYHVHSWSNNFRLKLKAYLPLGNPFIDSISELWPAANWQERETFDFYGVQFVGHPNLKRIMNVDEMDYHPLRKEYALEDETREDKNDKFFGR